MHCPNTHLTFMIYCKFIGYTEDIIACDMLVRPTLKITFTKKNGFPFILRSWIG